MIYNDISKFLACEKNHLFVVAHTDIPPDLHLPRTDTSKSRIIYYDYTTAYESLLYLLGELPGICEEYSTEIIKTAKLFGSSEVLRKARKSWKENTTTGITTIANDLT